MNHSPLIKRLSLLCLTTSVFYSSHVVADEFSEPNLTYSQSDFGGVGLMQMPSSRMMKDGELNLNVTNNETYLNYSVSLQVFPWLETVIRYTQVHDMLYSNSEAFSGDTDYTDKSIDAKVKFLDEGVYLPSLSIGVRDLGGTGLFDSEFIVANKRFGNLDFTLGIGWGYIGNRGNFKSEKVGSPDCGRNTGYTSTGGSVELGRMFTGCRSVFGGIEYQTPFEPLVVKVEYDGNDYKSDFLTTKGGETIPVSSPWNVGVVYKVADWARLRLSYERGNTVSAGLSLNTNLADLKPHWVDDTKPDYQPSTPVDDLSEQDWQQLRQDIARVAGYTDTRIYKDNMNNAITVTGKQVKYRDRDIANERVALVLANSGLMANQYHVVETSQYVPLTETVINTYGFNRVANLDYPEADFKDVETRRDVNTNRSFGELKSAADNDWSFGFSPSLQQSFGGSESFYLYAIGLNANADYRISDHFLASGSVYGKLVDNYDKFNYTVPPDGTVLKRVRTLARQYFEHPVRVSNLQLTYFDRWSDSLYSQTYAGYLESMFAGFGGEFIYRPMDTNWAIGIDGNYVKQRNPDSALGLFKEDRHYDKKTSRYYYVQTGTITGNATLYWQPKFWRVFDNTLLKISAGKYLTEDKGVTVDFSKQFDSGVIAGVYATKTNLSASEYGEGSFTKGFYISIPFDVMTVKPSVSRANISWSPLTRDGGQKLSRKYSLYDMTDGRSPWFTRKRIE